MWREVCRPGDGAMHNLKPIGLVVLAGFFILILMFANDSISHFSPAPKKQPVTHQAPPNPRSAAVLLGRVTLPDPADEDDFVSEAGEDNNAAMAAAAWQLDTDYKLSQIDMLRVWNLNNRWRPALDELQNTMIGLAGLATGGGTWVGHEICRNDLTLESGLIAPHAMALSEGEADEDEDPGAAAGSLRRREARTAQWEALWRRIEETANKRIRLSGDLDDIWKDRLDEVLEEVRRAHQALLPQLCGLADERAAQAVIQYYDRYFTDNFPDMSIRDDGE